jgi:hypothetical protein
MNISVPRDGRLQFNFATAAVANASLGRMPWDGIEQVGPDRYVVAGSWPVPSSISPSAAASRAMSPVEVPDAATPKSAAAALWPNLK